MEAAPKDRIVCYVAPDTQTGGLRLEPTDRKLRIQPFTLSGTKMGGAKEGDIVVVDGFANPTGQGKHVSRILGTKDTPAIYSLISLYEQGLTEVFSAAAVNESATATVPALDNREDLRTLPLVTIDGADARDFDDAVFAEKLPNGKYHLVVAIADVSWYVRPGSPLDQDAYQRGNSTYFPDMVVPMLPENLSNGLCSLKPHEDRACLAFHMWIDENGNMDDFKIVRGLMNSTARLTYEQVQSAKDGTPDATTAPLMDNVIKPLYEAYGLLRQAREERGAIDLDLPETKVKVVVGEDGKERPVSIDERLRVDSHRLIEEFMILANVAAASSLENKPCVYRVHDTPPSETSLEALRETLKPYGLELPPGKIEDPKVFNNLMKEVSKLEDAQTLTRAILRVQAKAIYDTENIGHFGLALEKYAHFTSPIRRYADLLVHRSLVDEFNLGAGGLSNGQSENLQGMSEHITETEQLSVAAERRTHDRLSAVLLSDKVGQVFNGVVNGVSPGGLFIRIDGAGADGFLPMRELPKDHYEYDRATNSLTGKKGTFKPGSKVEVRLIEADGIKGNILFETTNDNKKAGQPPGSGHKNKKHKRHGR